jgi:hypothetical protein
MESRVQSKQSPRLHDILRALPSPLILVLANVARIVKTGPFRAQHQQFYLRRELRELERTCPISA